MIDFALEETRISLEMDILNQVEQKIQGTLCNHS